MNPHLNSLQPGKRILISGAGFAGPALAYWLNQYGYHATIIEKAPSIRTGGYAVDIRGAAVDVVKKMGLWEEVIKKATAMRGSSFINIKGNPVASFNDPNLFGMRESTDTEIMRGDLTMILYQATQHYTEYLFDDYITNIDETNSEYVTVSFNRTEKRKFDVVVGADGLHSNTRNIVLGKKEEYNQFMGFYVAIFSVPNFLQLDHWSLSCLPSAGRMLSIYQTGNLESVKVFMMFQSSKLSYDHKDRTKQQNILETRFSAELEHMPEILAGMKNADDFYFDSVSQVHLDSLFHNRTVFVGDAGYCASPASGQGTSLALVGAYVLAGELAAANGVHRTAFLNYEHKMANFIHLNQQLANDILKDMLPKSALQARLQNLMIRLLFHLPGKEKILKGFMKKTQVTITEAATGIELELYRALLQPKQIADV